MTWIVVDIGCIECGASSGIVGMFDNEVAANAIAYQLHSEADFKDGGQHKYDVFPTPVLNAIHQDYAEYFP